MNTWLKTAESGNRTLVSFHNGDLINYWTPLSSMALYTGEIVDIDDGKLVVHYLERRPEHNNKLWKFPDFKQCAPHEVDPSCVIKHVHHVPIVLSASAVREAWGIMGYCVGVDMYCWKSDEDFVPLDYPEDEERSEDEEVPDENGIYPEMQDFIVPDHEGEAWCAPDPALLTEEQRIWVNQTHSAVRDWDGWVPSDPSQQAVKRFVDNMTSEHGHREADRQFEAGSSSSHMSSPSDI